MEEEGKKKTVINFQQVHMKLQIERACRIIANSRGNLYKTVSAGDTVEIWVHNNRRVGKPRQNLPETSIHEIWDILKQSDNRLRFIASDHTNPQKVEALKQFATQYTQT